MSTWVAALHVEFDHERARGLEPEDMVLKVVSEAFADWGIRAEVIIDDIGAPGVVRMRRETK